MKRAQIVEAKQPLVIDEISIPEPPDGGLVIKTTCSGICHTEIHQVDDEFELGEGEILRITDIDYYNLPVTPGHEIAGKIYSIGKNQGTGLNHKVGDRVVIYSWAACGHCTYCERDRSDMCNERFRCYGLGLPGGYANFVVVPQAKHALKLPDSIPFEVGCMLPCSGVTTYNAVTTIKPKVEESISFEGEASVLLVGAGGLGLWSLQIAKSVLPKGAKIVVADIAEEKLAIARERGCDDTVCWEAGKSEADLIALTKSKGRGGGGFDAVIDYVNTSVTTKRVFKCLRPNGILAVVGLFGGAASYSLPHMVLWCNQVKGIFVGTLRHLQELIQLVDKEKLIPPPLNFFKLEEANEGLDRLRQGKMNGRGIIKFE